MSSCTNGSNGFVRGRIVRGRMFMATHKINKKKKTVIKKEITPENGDDL